MAYAKGTIKIKNAEGNLVEFYPKSIIDNVIDSNGGQAISNTITEFESQITEAENSGGIEIMYEEPDSTNTADFSNETLIGWIEQDVFKITVDTTKLSSGNKITGIPFNLYLYHSGITLTVNWGDGTTTTLTRSNYSASKNGSVHTYSIAGTYTITVKSSDWENTYITKYGSNLNTINTLTSNIYYFRNTVISIDDILPPLKGTVKPESYDSALTTSNWTTETNHFSYLFYYCNKLTTICDKLFDNNTAVTDFYRCFDNCSSLTSIPSDLFKYNTAVTDFTYCFRSCTSLTNISSGLFDNCTAVTIFRYCFYNCSSLNDFTIHITSPNVTSALSFVTKKEGTTRTIYVPSGSNTETAFNSVASSLGLTIIGE